MDALKSQIFLYLGGQISLQQLREWVAPYTIEPGSHGEDEFSHIADELIGDFSDFDDKLLSESGLNANLKALADQQFASSFLEVTLEFGQYSRPSTRTEPVRPAFTREWVLA